MEPTGPGIRHVENERNSTTISRTTKDGRTVSYRLTVLQQPLRARACGAGAKSSADRRPVDPPPIVELKIFEEVENEQPRDITFSMNANYFLFAGIDNARVIAAGRGMSDSQNQLAVLTGTPVAGMVLLDRPNPAGYFIFADLSVRHEGKYRLVFSLYEELKNPQDEDAHEDPGRLSGPYVTHRVEVKSNVFTVYSAKKFPGLTESTSLSRVIAEQGCRVRIRRDVRMRRRDQKPGKDWEGYEEETADARARMSATPEGSGYQILPSPHPYMDPNHPISRPRSSSNTSHHSLAPSLVAHRPSLQDSGYQNHGYGTAPHTPQSAYHQTSPYGPSPTHNYANAPFMHQQSMQPPPHHYQQSGYQPPPLLPQPTSSQSNYHSSYGSSTPTQVAPGAPGYEPQERHRSSSDHSMSISSDSRRPSIGYGPAPPPPQAPAHGPRYSYPSEMSSQSSYQPQASYSNHHSHQSSYSSPDLYANSNNGNNNRMPLPPLEPVQPRTRTSFTTTPLSDRPFSNGRLPPLDTTISNKQPELVPLSPVGQPSAYFGAVQAPHEPQSHKRGYDEVFSSHHHREPLKQAARPSTPGHSYQPPYYNEVEVESDGKDPHELNYRRSNGTATHRETHVYHQYA